MRSPRRRPISARRCCVPRLWGMHVRPQCVCASSQSSEGAGDVRPRQEWIRRKATSIPADGHPSQPKPQRSAMAALRAAKGHGRLPPPQHTRSSCQPFTSCHACCESPRAARPPRRRRPLSWQRPPRGRGGRCVACGAATRCTTRLPASATLTPARPPSRTPPRPPRPLPAPLPPRTLQ